MKKFIAIFISSIILISSIPFNVYAKDTDIKTKDKEEIIEQNIDNKKENPKEENTSKDSTEKKDDSNLENKDNNTTDNKENKNSNLPSENEEKENILDAAKDLKENLSTNALEEDAVINELDAEEDTDNLPEEPNKITTTISKYVPRVGDEINFSIDGFSFETIRDPITYAHKIIIYNYENFIPEFKLQEIYNPPAQLEKYENNKLEKSGNKIILNNSSTNDTIIEKTNLINEIDNGFIIKRSDLSQDDLTSNLYLRYFYTNLDGSIYYKYINKIKQSDSTNIKYLFDDSSSIYPNITINSEFRYSLASFDEKYFSILSNKYYLYPETSEMILEIEDSDKNKEFNPGDEITLKATIKNNGNIPNTRYVAGIDFTNTNLSDKPDVATDPLKVTVKPKDSVSFPLKIKLPDSKDISKHLNSNNEIEIKPFLYTSPIIIDNENGNGKNIALSPYEEREYDSPITLKIKADKYTVDFNSNGGTNVDSQIVEKNKLAAKPSNPTKDGYTFLGWYDNKDLAEKEFDFANPITTNMTLYAKWEKNQENNKYAVDFNSNGGSYINSQIVKKGEFATKPSNPTKDGYEFLGWYTLDNANNYFNFNTAIEKDLTLYAKWKKKFNGGSNSSHNHNNNKPSKNNEVKPEVSRPYINSKHHKAYIFGYEDGTIKPNNYITRQEAAAIISRLSDIYSENNKNNYKDINISDWSYNYITSLSKDNILNGYPDGTFKPNNYISRAETAKIFSLYENKSGYSSKFFSDTSNHWALKYIENGVNNGWIDGYPDGTFKPDSYITRAEFIKIANKVFERNDVVNENLYKDKIAKDLEKNQWYYDDVLEASIDHYYVEENNIKTWTNK